MLAGARRRKRQRHVQMIRQRVVDRFDIGICEQRFVRIISKRNPERVSRFARSRAVARGDRADLAPRTLLHARQHLLRSDARRAQYAPYDSFHVSPLTLEPSSSLPAYAAAPVCLQLDGIRRRVITVSIRTGPPA